MRSPARNRSEAEFLWEEVRDFYWEKGLRFGHWGDGLFHYYSSNHQRAMNHVELVIDQSRLPEDDLKRKTLVECIEMLSFDDTFEHWQPFVGSKVSGYLSGKQPEEIVFTLGGDGNWVATNAEGDLWPHETSSGGAK